MKLLKYLILLPLLAFADPAPIPTNRVLRAETVTILNATNLVPVNARTVINSMIDAKIAGSGSGVNASTVTNIAVNVVGSSGTVYRAEWVLGDTANSNHVIAVRSELLETNLLFNTRLNAITNYVRFVEVESGIFELYKVTGE